MQNQYPGYPPQQQGWGQQPPPGQYGAPPQNQQWGQQPAYGAPPPGQPQQGGWGQAPPPQQQQQWGAPPPQGHPPPGQHNQQWGPPPAQGAYGTPPPNQYQAPPPQQGWGQPQPGPPGQYGAPPQQPYGAPPPGGQPPYGAPPHQQQYGAPPQAHAPYGGHPPQQQFGPPTQPSLGYGPMQTANLDMAKDVEGLRSAMKGFGTNEKALIAIVSKKDPIQINTLRTQYDQRLMKNLINDLDKETSGYFGKGLMQIVRGPLVGDCNTLYTAMKGLGTKEAAVDDVLVGRSNADINAIKAEYQRLYKTTLEADLRGDLSGDTEQMYMIIINARRNEDSAPVLPHDVEKDVTELQRAMGNIISKNSIQVCEILFGRNDAQLRAIAQAYQQRFQTPLEKAVRSKFNGHMEDALVLLLQRAGNRADAEAVRLEESMAGLGTKDELLVQRVVRCHWDQNFMRAVADAYKRRYGKTLVRRIEGETRGDYEKLMVACVQ